MTTGAFSNAGTKLYASATLPATHDAAGFAALTWTEVKDVMTIPAFGRTHEQITHTPLNDKSTYYLKGGFAEGTPTISMAISQAGAAPDPGQAILIAALDNACSDISFRVDFNDNPCGTSNSKRYFRATVFSAPENVGTRTAVGMMDVQIGINGEIVKVAAVA